MIYLYNLQKISDTDSLVRAVHLQPFDPVDGLGKTQAELEATGIFVDTLPTSDATKIVGNFEELHANPSTKEVWYVYTARPKTQEEIIADLQSQNAQMILALVNGGLM